SSTAPVVDMRLEKMYDMSKLRTGFVNAITEISNCQEIVISNGGEDEVGRVVLKCKYCCFGGSEWTEYSGFHPVVFRKTLVKWKEEWNAFFAEDSHALIPFPLFRATRSKAVQTEIIDK